MTITLAEIGENDGFERNTPTKFDLNTLLSSIWTITCFGKRIRLVMERIRPLPSSLDLFNSFLVRACCLWTLLYVCSMYVWAWIRTVPCLLLLLRFGLDSLWCWCYGSEFELELLTVDACPSRNRFGSGSFVEFKLVLVAARCLVKWFLEDKFLRCSLDLCEFDPYESGFGILTEFVWWFVVYWKKETMSSWWTLMNVHHIFWFFWLLIL
jgi:hypothetical protein